MLIPKKSISVALTLGELTYDYAVRLDTIRPVDAVILFCFVTSKLSVSVFVSVVAWLALRTSCSSTYAVVAFVAS